MERNVVAIESNKIELEQVENARLGHHKVLIVILLHQTNIQLQDWIKIFAEILTVNKQFGAILLMINKDGSIVIQL